MGSRLRRRAPTASTRRPLLLLRTGQSKVGCCCRPRRRALRVAAQPWKPQGRPAPRAWLMSCSPRRGTSNARYVLGARAMRPTARRRPRPWTHRREGVVPIRPENAARYPADWKARSRFVRLHRARGRCEWCGAVNGQSHPATGAKVVLTCAHVFDRRPEAYSLLNLAALCQRCHNRHDAADRRAGRRVRTVAASEQLRLGLEAA